MPTKTDIRNSHKTFFKTVEPFLSPLQYAMLQAEEQMLKKSFSPLGSHENKLSAQTYMPPDSLFIGDDDFFSLPDNLARKFEPLFLRLDFDKREQFEDAVKIFLGNKNLTDEVVQTEDIFISLPLSENKIDGGFHLQFHFGGHYLDPEVFLDTSEKIIRQNGSSLRDFFFAALLSARFPLYKLEGKKNTQTHRLEDFRLSSRRNYFTRILLSRKPSRGLDYLAQNSILQIFLPEVTDGMGLQQNQFHSYDIYHHLLQSCDGVQEADLTLRFSALLHDAGKVPTRKEKENGEATFYNHETVSARMVPAIMKRLGIGKEIGMDVRFLVKNHMFHYTDDWTDKAIRRFMKRVPKEFMWRLIQLRIADRKGSGKRNYFPPALNRLLQHIRTVEEKESEFKVGDLEIGGKDLLQIGLPPGRLFGEILREILEAVKNNQLSNEKEILLIKAKELAEQKGYSNLTA